MQDLAAILEEVGSLCSRFGVDSISTTMSQDLWNPVAAIEIRDFDLPSNLYPSRVSLRVPIPNLYAFSSSASVVILNKEIADSNLAKGINRPLLGLKEITADSVARNLKYFADLRENEALLIGSFYLYIMPPWTPEKFVHRTLSSFCDDILVRLQDAESAYANECKYCTETWRRTSNPWWLLRIAQLHLDAGDEDKARAFALEGIKLYPLRNDFGEFLHQIDRTE